MGQIASNTAGVVVDGANYSTSTSSFPFTAGFGDGRGTGGPKAYLNWMVFDRDYNLITAQSGYSRMSAAPSEHGQDVAHERLYSPNLVIAQPGYVYVYLSNEEASALEVYFDDFKVTHVKSPVIATDDYYPFGLRYNSYSRESSMPNKHKLFQGQEHIDDLGLNWDSFKWRNHQPDIGRFFSIDPLAAKYVYNSPYAFSENHVTSHVELEGLEKISIHSASFAPYNEFGGPYRGDGSNRRFGTNPNASSRISGSVNMNLSGSGITQIGDAQGKGSFSQNNVTGSRSFSEGKMTSTLENRGANGTSASADFGFHLSGSNSLIPRSPDIDVKGQMQIRVTELGDKGSIATFSGAVKGDKFPANETYITDQSGTGVFLGVSGADVGLMGMGNEDTGPVTQLPGDNNRQMSQFNISVTFDSKGNIQGVQVGGKSYSPQDWNKQFQNQNPQSGNTSTNRQ